MGLRYAPSLLLAALCVTARAEPAPDISEELRLFESTERNEDPLGIDESTGRGLEEAARALAPKPPPPRTATAGEVLTALEQVDESEHAVGIELARGLAFVTVRARFGSRSDAASELAYRLPLPADAVVSAVRLCIARACHDATPNTGQREPPEAAAGAPAPFVWAVPVRDARGRALSIVAGPITRAAPLELAVSYVASAPLRGGRARFVLPARGQDPRVRPAEVQVTTRYPAALSAERLVVDPAQRAQVVASLRPGAGSIVARERARCAGGPCSHDFEAAPPAPLSDRPLWLVLDASPSMEGPARGRVDVVLAALLSVLPGHTQVRAFAFGQRAVELGSHRADATPLRPLSDALLMELGPSTRLSSVVALGEAQLAGARPRLVVLSDGLLDDSPRERRTHAQLRRLGIEPWLVALGDVPLSRSGTFSGVLELSALADEALRDGDLEPLAEALSAIASPQRKAGLRAGEQRVIESAPLRAPPATPNAPWLAHWLAREATPSDWLWGVRAEGPVRAEAFRAAPMPPAPPDTGMPAESVLNMLRTQLVPKARACLRADRKGRGDYAVALTFHALFARREVAEARVEGAIPAALRECLEQTLDQLRVPVFSGRIRVRYPIHTEREPPPPVIELEAEVWQRVERVISPEGPGRVPMVD
jgi:hypothetical protein